jgi:hypothetical protein
MAARAARKKTEQNRTKQNKTKQNRIFLEILAVGSWKITP